MVRAIDRDFEEVKAFLNAYTLGGIAKDPEQLKVVRAGHKAYLPFLQFWASCSDELSKGEFLIFGQKLNADSQQYNHLRETISDVGSGLFCCLHGAYKPGHMALRSSIENYLRFAAGSFNDDAIKTTSIFELFEIAKGTLPFIGSRNVHLTRLRSSYVELCKFSHSASLAHMAGIHALAHFPSFDEKAFQGWLTTARTCMSTIVTLTLLGHSPLYLNAHFAAQELLDQLLHQDERLLILRGGVELTQFAE